MAVRGRVRKRERERGEYGGYGGTFTQNGHHRLWQLFTIRALLSTLFSPPHSYLGLASPFLSFPLVMPPSRSRILHHQNFLASFSVLLTLSLSLCRQFSFSSPLSDTSPAIYLKDGMA